MQKLTVRLLWELQRVSALAPRHNHGKTCQYQKSVTKRFGETPDPGRWKSASFGDIGSQRADVEMLHCCPQRSSGPFAHLRTRLPRRGDRQILQFPSFLESLSARGRAPASAPGRSPTCSAVSIFFSNALRVALRPCLWAQSCGSTDLRSCVPSAGRLQGAQLLQRGSMTVSLSACHMFNTALGAARMEGSTTETERGRERERAGVLT